MRHCELDHTITTFEVMLEYHTDEFKPECIERLNEYKRKLERMQDWLSDFPSGWGRMSKAKKEECSALMDKADLLVDEASKYLEEAKKNS